MNKLFEEYFWKVKIKWSKSLGYEKVKMNGSEYDETANFYMIIGKYLNNPPKLFYIGKTYKQWVSFRLNQEDHKQRCNEIKENFPKHDLFVSFGELFLDKGLKTKKRIDEIESILIYAHDSEYIFNISKLSSLKVNDHYQIINLGHRAPLFKEINFGLSVK